MEENTFAIQIDWSIVHSTMDLLKLLREKQVPSKQYGSYVEQYQSIKAREKGIPLHGLFELTPFCNLDCKMCYVHLEHETLKYSRIIDVDTWKNLIKQAYDAGMRYVTLSGGECLIYSGFKELYLYLYELGIRPAIKTNALQLTKDLVSFFKKYPPKKFEISLYGCSEEGYERVTGHRVFQVVISNLILLKEADLPVFISVTPSKFLQNEVAGIVEITKQLKFPYFINYCLFTPRQETGRDKCELSTQEYLNILRDLSKLNDKLNIPLDDGVVLPDVGRGTVPSYGVTCGAGRNAFNITWDGMLCGCLNLPSIKSSVVDKSFEAAWEDIHTQAKNIPTPMECNQCAYKIVCVSCIACHNIDGDTSHCNQEICERTRAMIKEGYLKLPSLN